MNDTNTYVASARLDGDKLSDVKVIFRAIPHLAGQPGWAARPAGASRSGATAICS